MADYSDETLRALIRQLITEDQPRVMTAITANPDDRALITKQAAMFLKFVFSPAGAVGLAALGLVFEREFTQNLLAFGLDQTQGVLEGLKAFKEEDGNIFDKLVAFYDTVGDKTRKNKYNYMQKLNEQASENTSLTAIIVDELVNSYKEYKPSKKEIKSGAITEADIAIYNAINANDLSEVFDETQFEKSTDASGNPLLTINEINPKDDYDSVESEYIKKRDKAITDGRHINANIIEALRQSHEHYSKDAKPSAKEDLNIAMQLYDISVAGVDGQVEKVTAFQRIDDIEMNLQNSFAKTVQDYVKDKAGEGFEDFVGDTVDIVKNKLGI